MAGLTYKGAVSRSAEVVLSYAAGLLLLILASVAAGVIYVLATDLIGKGTGIDLQHQVPWFKEAFLALAIGLTCAVSTLAVNDMLSADKPFLWGWPLVVVAFSVLCNGLMADGWVITSEALQQGFVALAVVVVLRLREGKYRSS